MCYFYECVTRFSVSAYVLTVKSVKLTVINSAVVYSVLFNLLGLIIENKVDIIRAADFND